MNTQKYVSFCKKYKEKYRNKKPIFNCIGKLEIEDCSLMPYNNNQYNVSNILIV